MDKSCLMKAGIVAVGGGGFGFLMAVFMNAVEFNRDIEFRAR